MRAALLVLALFPAAFAYAVPFVLPREIHVRVNEWTTAVGSNATIGGTGGTITFKSADESIAFVRGSVSWASGPGYFEDTIDIKGIAPGKTYMTVNDAPIATIFVTCGPVEPFVALDPELRGTAHTPVKLTVTGSAPSTTFRWYRGRTGDTTSPLAGGASELTFTPPTTGTHYVWVSVISPCAQGSAEFRIDVTSPKRRAVR